MNTNDLYLEGKPVSVGDRIYAKHDMRESAIVTRLHNGNIVAKFGDGSHIQIDCKDNKTELCHFTWSSTPKRTFKLNGVELPCPFNMNSDAAETVPLSIGCHTIWFCSETDKNIVEKCIVRILEEARDK